MMVFMKDNGKMLCEMVRESMFGLIEVIMKVIGLKTKLMVLVN